MKLFDWIKRLGRRQGQSRPADPLELLAVVPGVKNRCGSPVTDAFTPLPGECDTEDGPEGEETLDRLATAYAMVGTAAELQKIDDFMDAQGGGPELTDDEKEIAREATVELLETLAAPGLVTYDMASSLLSLPGGEEVEVYVVRGDTAALEVFHRSVGAVGAVLGSIGLDGATVAADCLANILNGEAETHDAPARARHQEVASRLSAAASLDLKDLSRWPRIMALFAKMARGPLKHQEVRELIDLHVAEAVAQERQAQGYSALAAALDEADEADERQPAPRHRSPCYLRRKLRHKYGVRTAQLQKAGMPPEAAKYISDRVNHMLRQKADIVEAVEVAQLEWLIKKGFWAAVDQFNRRKDQNMTVPRLIASGYGFEHAQYLIAKVDRFCYSGATLTEAWSWANDLWNALRSENPEAAQVVVHIAEKEKGARRQKIVNRIVMEGTEAVSGADWIATVAADLTWSEWNSKTHRLYSEAEAVEQAANEWRSMAVPARIAARFDLLRQCGVILSCAQDLACKEEARFGPRTPGWENAPEFDVIEAYQGHRVTGRQAFLAAAQAVLGVNPEELGMPVEIKPLEPAPAADDFPVGAFLQAVSHAFGLPAATLTGAAPSNTLLLAGKDAAHSAIFTNDGQPVEELPLALRENVRQAVRRRAYINEAGEALGQLALPYLAAANPLSLEKAVDAAEYDWHRLLDAERTVDDKGAYFRAYHAAMGRQSSPGLALLEENRAALLRAEAEAWPFDQPAGSSGGMDLGAEAEAEEETARVLEAVRSEFERLSPEEAAADDAWKRLYVAGLKARGFMDCEAQWMTNRREILGNLGLPAQDATAEVTREFNELVAASEEGYVTMEDLFTEEGRNLAGVLVRPPMDEEAFLAAYVPARLRGLSRHSAIFVSDGR